MVPQARTREIIREYHSRLSEGHLGITKAVEKIKENFYWVGIKDSVAVCIRISVANRKARKVPYDQMTPSTGANEAIKTIEELFHTIRRNVEQSPPHQHRKTRDCI
uniref:Integrase_H2C2 domain-containing protein n=1 Tax=Glossina austeni TaxID=7395 RepID=A0A1A9VFK8_GLOAU